MKIATIIVHKNLSKEDKLKAINEGTPLEVDVIDNYSSFSNKSVSFDMISDYLQKNDTKSVDALIAVNNIVSYELNKDSILVKVLQENGQFTLKALQVPNPYDDSIEVDNHTIIVVFKTLNTNISNPNKLDETRHEVNIAVELDTEIIHALAEKGITLSGTSWKNFTVQGNCIVSFEATNTTTSFYGNNPDGFLIV